MKTKVYIKQLSKGFYSIKIQNFNEDKWETKIGQDVLKLLINPKYEAVWLTKDKKKLSDIFDKKDYISELHAPWYKKLKLKLLRLCF